MTDLERIKNEVAVEHGYESMTLLVLKAQYTVAESALNIVAERYAELKCIEQRRACAKGVEDITTDRVQHWILNTDLATSKTT